MTRWGGLTRNTATILAHGVMAAAAELGPGNHATTVELDDGHKFIVVIVVPRPPAKDEQR